MKLKPIESAPKDGARILLAADIPGLGLVSASGSWTGYTWRGWNGAIHKQPTHWCPLPTLEGEDGLAPDQLRRDEYSVMVIAAKVGNAIKTVEKVRRDSANTGHHCAYRQAADSLCDQLKIDVPLLQHAGQYYSTLELKELEAVTKERDALRAHLAGALDEYSDQKAQFGADEIWKKYENSQIITGAESYLEAISKEGQAQ